jgi:outer membrane protein TolC
MLRKRSRESIRKAISLVLATTTVFGCQSTPKDIVFDHRHEFRPIGTQIEYADTCVQPATAVEQITQPHTLNESDLEDYEYWNLTLDEAVRIGLANSTVIRDLGARIMDNPDAGPTTYDPAIIQMDPRVGEEAALAAFDAQFSTSILFSRTERGVNNPFFVGGLLSRAVTSNEALFMAEIAKTAATGTQFAIRNFTNYNRANQEIRQNLFSSFYDTIMEAEVRHPLLRGGGLTYNRIAGPNVTPGNIPNNFPGNFRGIVLARINTDIALADFEIAVREYVNEVYQTYWQLYFSYRDLDARRAGRAAAMEAWRTARVQLETGAGDALNEALAQQQYFDFEAQVKNALSGSELLPGVFFIERQLRLLLGVPMNDGRLIRPADEPSMAETVFDWQESVFLSLNRRVELRRQHWNIKRRELELLASRNLLQMQLDFVSQYRWRGFGDDLLGNREVENGSAFRDLFSGELQDWTLGLELTTPIGNRQGHVAVRSAELALARERAILNDQEQYVMKDLSDAMAEVARAQQLTRTNYNQINAARRRLALTQARFEAGEERFEFVLEAQQLVAETESAFFQSLVDYNLAIALVHRAQGTFLDYMGVELTEGPWSRSSYFSARKEARRFTRRAMDCYTVPCPVSRGRYQQTVLPRGEAIPVPTEAPVPGSPGESILRPEDELSPTPLPEPAPLPEAPAGPSAAPEATDQSL